MVKIERSKNAPSVLADSVAKDRYRSASVVEQLVEDSGDKCYICESSPVRDPEVEYLRPHFNGRYPDRKYDWENLFYSCSHCNKVKNKPKYADMIVDCCKRDPEELFIQALFGDSVSVVPCVEGDEVVVRTAELIEEVFMSDDPVLRKKASEARLRDLQRQMNYLYTQLERYSDKSAAAAERAFAERTIAALLERKSAFAGFLRSYVRERSADYPHLLKYLA